MLASGKKYIIKMLVKKSCIFIMSACDNSHIRRVKAFPDNMLYDQRRMRGIGTGLENYCIAGCKSVITVLPAARASMRGSILNKKG